MRIEDSNKTSKTEKSSSKAKTSSHSDGLLFASLISVADDVSDTSSVVSTSGIEGTNAVFAAQVEDSTARKARNLRAVKRGEDLLDKLEKIRTAIMSGSVSKDSIIALGQSLRTKRELDIDPKLEVILNDIELRVEVELAKISISAK